MPTEPIIADSSAWIEFLRATGSRADQLIDELLETPDALLVTGPVVLEVLTGARNQNETARLRDLLARCEYAPVHDPVDFVGAAVIYRACRVAGKTLRGHADCLIAAVAMRLGAAVLHMDSDFNVIAEHAPLTTV